MRSWLFAAVIGLSTLASAQVLDSRTFPTDGHPMQAIWTPDGQHVLVTVTRQRESGIEVFRVDGDNLTRVAYQPLGNEAALGIALIPHTKLLAVGLSDAGVAFLPLDATLEGKAKPSVLPQGYRSGSIDLAITPICDTLFVANEYLDGGTVGVIALHRDQGELVPVTTVQLPIRHAAATPGIALSPDGTRLYALGEVLMKDWPKRLPGHGIPELQHDGCTQVGPESSPNGALFVFDAAKAAALPAKYTPEQERDATLRYMNAGCSPVRVVVSSNGQNVYVTARGDNKVLAFDAAALEHDPDHAFLRAIRSGGEAPVGLALFDHDSKLLVANSNRFTKGPGNATVIDLAAPAKHAIVQTIKTDKFPRDITASFDGHKLLLTVFANDELMLLTMK